VALRAGDYALAAAAVTISEKSGVISDVRIALSGVGQVPLRASAAEDVLKGNRLAPDAITAAAASAAAGCDPMSDLHASADYRRHLAEVLVRRCLIKAQTRIGNQPT
jgi:aerobic carbon-monoxide dehydrogenase medium subunit